MLYNEQNVTSNGSIRSISTSFNDELAQEIWDRRKTFSLKKEKPYCLDNLKFDRDLFYR